MARVSKLRVNSVDSGSHVKYAAAGRLYTAPQIRHANLTPHERVHLALCNLAAAAGPSMPLSAASFSTLTTRTLEH